MAFKPSIERPRFLTIPTYDDWLEDAVTGGDAGIYVDDASTVNVYAIRFNRDIASIVAAYGEEQINKAIWHIYGATSGYMWDAMDKSLNTRRVEFMTSVKDLYTNGFARFCSPYFGHLDRGPKNARPMNSACYMLWDMDGIECPAINGDTELLAASVDVLTHALGLDNLACNESALHGLGHLATMFAAKTSPPINAFLRRKNLPVELRDYALNAKAGSIL